MKNSRFIFDKDGVKRAIESPFLFCASAEDMRAMAKEFNHAAATLEEDGSPYGWVYINTGLKGHPTINTPPKEWTE